MCRISCTNLLKTARTKGHLFKHSNGCMSNLQMKSLHAISSQRDAQKPGEMLTEFLQDLQRLSKDCNIKSVTAEQYREQLICDSFINGLLSLPIRRLLENRHLDLKTGFDQANALDLAQQNSGAYAIPESSFLPLKTSMNHLHQMAIPLLLQ